MFAGETLGSNPAPDPTQAISSSQSCFSLPCYPVTIYLPAFLASVVFFFFLEKHTHKHRTATSWVLSWFCPSGLHIWGQFIIAPSSTVHFKDLEFLEKSLFFRAEVTLLGVCENKHSENKTQRVSSLEILFIYASWEGISLCLFISTSQHSPNPEC